jgi:hypothetical protein
VYNYEGSKSTGWAIAGALICVAIVILAIAFWLFASYDAGAQGADPTNTPPYTRPTPTPGAKPEPAGGPPEMVVDCNDGAQVCDVRIYPNGFRFILILGVEATHLVYWDPLIVDGGWGLRFYFSARKCSGAVTDFSLLTSRDANLDYELPRRDIGSFCKFVPLAGKGFNHGESFAVLRLSGAGSAADVSNGSWGDKGALPDFAEKPNDNTDWRGKGRIHFSYTGGKAGRVPFLD